MTSRIYGISTSQDKFVYIGRTSRDLTTRLQEHLIQSTQLLTDKDKFIFDNRDKVTITELFTTHNDVNDETFVIWAMSQFAKLSGFENLNTTAGHGLEPVDKLTFLPSISQTATIFIKNFFKAHGLQLPKFVAWDGKMVEKQKKTLLLIEVVSNENIAEHGRMIGKRELKSYSGGPTTPNVRFKWLNTNRPDERNKVHNMTFVDTHHACVDWKVGERYAVNSYQKEAPDGKLVWCWDDHEKVENTTVDRLKRSIQQLERLNMLKSTPEVRNEQKAVIAHIEWLEEKLQ